MTSTSGITSLLSALHFQWGFLCISTSLSLGLALHCFPLQICLNIFPSLHLSLSCCPLPSVWFPPPPHLVSVTVSAFFFCDSKTTAFPQQQTLMRQELRLKQWFPFAPGQNNSLSSTPTHTHTNPASHSLDTHTRKHTPTHTKIEKKLCTHSHRNDSDPHTHAPAPIIKIYVSLLIFQSLSSPSTWQSQLERDMAGRDLHPLMHPEPWRPPRGDWPTRMYTEPLGAKVGSHFGCIT